MDRPLRKSELSRRLGIWSAFLVALFVAPATTQASSVTLNGSFTQDDTVQLYDFTVVAPDVIGALSVDLRSYGYAGGTTNNGGSIPPGGFDTILTLFSQTGNLIAQNDDGPGVAVDPLTGLAADARITATLASGNYILALTQYDNFANSTDLSAGFSEEGHSNFTADPTFTSGTSCPGNVFRDISGTSAGCRTGAWTVDFVDVVTATERSTAVTPEPSTLLLLGFGLLALRLKTFRRRGLMAPASLFCFLLLSGSAAQAQTDFSQVGDILNGKRQLLKDQDLIITRARYEGYISSTLNLFTANGQISHGPDASDSCQPYKGSTGTFAGRLYASDHDQYFVLCNNYNFDEHSVELVDGTKVTLGPKYFTVGSQPPNAVLADFSGTGYPDLAVAWQGNILLVSAANPDGSPNLHFGNSGKPQSAETLFAMTAGDFNGDGKLELAGLAYQNNGLPSIEIYTVDPTTLVVTKVAETTPTYAGEAGPIIAYSMTAGKFTDANHQQLILSYAEGGVGSTKLVAFDFASGSLKPIEQRIFDTQSQQSGAGINQVQAARFDLQGPYDQVAFQAAWNKVLHPAGAQYVRIFTLDPKDLSFQLKATWDFGDPNICLSRMVIGNFDKKQIVNGQSQYDPSPQIALIGDNCKDGAETLVLSSVDPKTFNPSSNSFFHFTTTANGGAVSLALAAGDLQGRSYVLGAPTKVTIQGAIQPSVIAGMPPMHIDYVVPAGSTTPVVLNFSADPDAFSTSYQTSSESKVETNNTDTISWSAGAMETVGGSVTVGLPDVEGLEVKDTLKAAQDFKGATETQYGSFKGNSYSRTSTTQYGDFGIFTQKNFYIWVYPVIGKTICPASKPACDNSQKLPMTMQFSAPGNTQESSIDGNAIATYQPPWEPGNIFSYPANLAQLQKIYPNLSLLSKRSDQWFTDSVKTVEIASWNVGSSGGTSSTLDKTFSFENEFSVSGSYMATPGIGVSGNYGLDLSGSFGFSSLNQSTTTLNESTGIGVTKNGGVATPALYQYGITSYLVGRTQPGGYVDDLPLSTTVQTFDFLQAAFVANPLDAGAGSWWQQHYRDVPDVALNHPSRWSVLPRPLANTIPPECVFTGTGTSQMDCAEKGLDDATNPWLSPFSHMRGFFISSAAFPGQGPLLTSATAGAKLRLQARVYNYSFASMPGGSTVRVRFYAQPWDQNLNVALSGKPSFLVGEDVLSPIPPFSDSPDKLNWVLANTNFDTTGYDNQFFTFWVVCWIQNADGTLASEAPSHGLKSIPGTLTSFQQVQTEDYSNNVGFWKQAFYVAPPAQAGSSTPSATNAKMNISKIQLSATRVAVGQPIAVSALLSAADQGISNAAAFFWDEDPKGEDAVAFGLESPSYIQANGTHQVSAIYRPKHCGTYPLFITVTNGTPNEMTRRSSPIQVACGAKN